MIYPTNYEYIKGHKKYHHIKKGCVMKYAPYKTVDSNWSEEYFCKTHNVLCSKTGWELGWYMGNKSERGITEFTCKRCGCIFTSDKSWRNFCDNCKK